MRLSSDPAARRRLAALAVVAVLAVVVGVVLGAQAGDGGAPNGSTGGGSARSADGPGSTAPAGGRDDAITKAVARLPLDRLVGQVLMLSFQGATAPPYVQRALRTRRVAGVILFRDNAPDAASTRALTVELQRAAGGGALISADQEGGEIRILGWAAPEAAQSDLADPAAARTAAAAAARDLRAAGVNVNLAPVADVAAGPDSVMAARAYPGDAASVAANVRAAVAALQSGRVAATLKHFPGLGAATANTDDGGVTIDASIGADLAPFRAGIAAGAGLVMASHALYTSADAENVASQSGALLTGLLRNRLRFAGVIVTDSLEARAVTDRSGIATAALDSLAAGADLILMTGQGSYRPVYLAVLAQARRSATLRARLRASAARVLVLKRSLGLRAIG